MSPRNRTTTSRSATGRIRHRHRRTGQTGRDEQLGGQDQQRAQRAGGAAGAGRLRPELRWEVIDLPGGGRYVARREPSAHVLLPAADSTQTGTGGVLVVETHDLQLAATTAWQLWCEYVGGRLTVPRVGWWRSLPADPQTSTSQGEQMWWPARPGSPGAVPAVEWPAPPFNPGPWPWLGAPTCEGGER